MTANLILSLSQEQAAKPYKFKATNIGVFSFEEAQYHCLHYWKQSVDDFTSDEFIDWVKTTLNLNFISSKLKEIAKLHSFSERLIRFLSLTDYLDYGDAEALRTELNAWESRKEWEKLKERADDLMNTDEPEKAFALYKKALLFEDNAQLYNNAAIALMKQGEYAEAAGYLRKAMYKEPENVPVILHLAEAYIMAGAFDLAGKTLGAAESYGDSADIHFFRAEIQERAGNSAGAVPLYEKAIAMDPATHYIYRFADVLVNLRMYERAAAVMDLIDNKDRSFLKKQAELFVKNNNIPAAIKCMEKALLTNRSSVDLWTRLAAYYRQDYDLNHAHSAISAAIAIDPADARANLEYARIKKAQGRIKDYQLILNTVLTGLKNRYRENLSYE
ncbi:MAG: tetratricopeptide repeat protein [Clostridiales bacterium]|jgi:tetratricopeptide (TPR) repeat protein|nr:tetratricopeptide repeat protein [Clostridiales bacterium]